MIFTKKLITLILIFLSLIFYAQSNEAIEKQIEEAVNLSTENPPRSISLFTQALKDAEKIGFDKAVLKCKSSLAILYFNSGEFEKVIEISDDIELRAKKLNNFSALTGIYRNVSASYGMLGLDQQAIENLDKALDYAKYIEDKNVRHYRIGLIYDSYSASYDNLKESPELILSYINKSIEELNKIPDEGTREDVLSGKHNAIGIQYVKLGKLYSESFKDYQSAEKYYLKALEVLENPKLEIEVTNKIAAFSYISEFYLTQKDFEKSIFYGEKALDFTNKSEQPELRKQLYNTLFKAYLETGQKEKSKHFAELYTQLNDTLRQADRNSASTSIKKIIAKKESNYNQSLKIALGIVGAIVIVSLIFFLFWRRKNMLIHKKYEELINKINIEKEEKNSLDTQDPEAENKENIESKSGIQITDETLKALLQKLDKFETSDKYLRKDISLTWMANNLNTNTKYLSEIIKVYKNKSFSGYINGLRIEYVIRKLISNPQYREYKISYLADECGYASRQVFVIGFKKETGFTPSYFIENLKKDSHKD